MKLRIIILIISLLVGAVAVPANAGHLSLKPTGFLALKEASNQPVSGGVFVFDLSGIPTDNRIDLAEVTITVNSDTALGKTISVFAGAATGSWTPSGIASTGDVPAVDSMLSEAICQTGNGQSVEFEVTELLKLWHTGKLANKGFVVSIPGNGNHTFAIQSSGSDIDVTLSVYFSK
jgi:hypothetical protein